MLGPENFEVKNILGQRKILSQKQIIIGILKVSLFIKVSLNVVQSSDRFTMKKLDFNKKNWIYNKKFGSKMILGPTKFWVQRNFGSEKILSLQIFWSRKFFGPKILST